MSGTKDVAEDLDGTTGTKDVSEDLDETNLNVPGPENISSQIPISNNSKQKGPGGSSVRNEAPKVSRDGVPTKLDKNGDVAEDLDGTTGTKDLSKDLDETNLNLPSPRNVSSEVPNIKKRSSHIQSDDTRIFKKCARTSSTPPIRGRARIPSRGRASYQPGSLREGCSSVVHLLPPVRDQDHEISPVIPNDSTDVEPPVDNNSEVTSEQTFSVQVERLKRKLAILTESYDILSSNHNELKVKYEKLETDLLNETVLRKALQMNVESLTHTLNQTEIKLKGLEKINEQLESQHDPIHRGSRFRARIIQSMDKKYLGFVLALEKKFPSGL